MRNQHPGTCYRCGKRVEAGAGHFERVTKSNTAKLGPAVSGKKWLLQHADCAIEHRGTAHNALPADDGFSRVDHAVFALRAHSSRHGATPKGVKQSMTRLGFTAEEIAKAAEMMGTGKP